ncbi:hypothetical protein ACQ4PT_065267 [Festuca glaucescens]
MEVGSPTSSAGSRRGGGDREEAARGSGGAMRARVCARVRTPQGVGALLLVGGAIVGAAVFAWRRHCDRKKAKNHQRCKEEEKVPEDSGVVENEQVRDDGLRSLQVVVMISFLFQMKFRCFSLTI